MTARIDAPHNVNDFAALTSLRRDARAQSPEALREAARQFESLFTRIMLESMRSASFGDPLFGGAQADFYQGMFDDQLAVELSKGRGLGLADMLIEQLTRAGLSGDASLREPSGVSTAPPQAAASATKSTTASTTFEPRTRSEFVNALWPHAVAAGRELGVDPRAVIAHAALETGWGRSLPADATGRSSFNLFGVKATGNWRGDAVAARTTEYESGEALRRVEGFRAYESVGASVRDYASLLGTNSRYASVRNTGSDITAFAAGLQRAGYATDPDYAKKLTAVAAQLGLASCASAALKQSTPVPTTSLTGSVSSRS